MNVIQNAHIVVVLLLFPSSKVLFNPLPSDAPPWRTGCSDALTPLDGQEGA